MCKLPSLSVPCRQVTSYVVCASLGGVVTRAVQFLFFFFDGAAAIAASAPPPAPPQPPPSPGAPAAPSSPVRFRAESELEFHAMAALQAHAVGSLEVLARPCVDCGLITGSFCDKCLAVSRMPEEVWAEGQHTPLCNDCDDRHRRCHYCRHQVWCAPAPHR